MAQTRNTICYTDQPIDLSTEHTTSSRLRLVSGSNYDHIFIIQSGLSYAPYALRMFSVARQMENPISIDRCKLYHFDEIDTAHNRFKARIPLLAFECSQTIVQNLGQTMESVWSISDEDRVWNCIEKLLLWTDVSPHYLNQY